MLLLHLAVVRLNQLLEEHLGLGKLCSCKLLCLDLLLVVLFTIADMGVEVIAL